MTTVVAFDTLRFVRRLQDVGVPEEQAEAFSEAIRDVQEARLETLATKADLREVKQELKSDIQALESSIQTLKVTLKGEIRELESSMQTLEVTLKGNIRESEARVMGNIRESEARVMGEIRLNRWMLVLVIAATVLPALRTFLQ